MATICMQDFYNLVDVYLDAVFFPKCVEDVKTFQQEGWHYELNDPSEDITYKGHYLLLIIYFCPVTFRVQLLLCSSFK